MGLKVHKHRPLWAIWIPRVLMQTRRSTVQALLDKGYELSYGGGFRDSAPGVVSILL